MAIRKIKIRKVQNLIDICIQVYGTRQQLFKMAKDNGLAIDSTVLIGDELAYDDAIGDLLVLNRINVGSLNIINPAPGTSAAIDYWTDGVGTVFTDGIGTKFTVIN